MRILILIVMALFATFAFMGCKDSPAAVDPGEPEPPIVEPVPPVFEDVITGKFWSVDKLERYQVTARSAENPYELDVCMFFGEDGMITFWLDDNDDGLLSPSEEFGTPIPWSIVGNVLTIDGDDWSLAYFTNSGWAIEADVTGTDIGDVLGNDGTPYTGWLRVHYVPCLKAKDDGVITASFAFVFDDMGDTNADWVRYCKNRWRVIETFDFVDGFYFTFGENHIIIASYFDGPGSDIDTAIFIGNDEYGMQIFDEPTGFKPNHVYNMTMTIDSADVALFEFVSRVDGHNFDTAAQMDHSVLGEIIIRGINDVDVPVVNPTI